MGAATASKENYLKAILRLEREQGSVRAVDIAAVMQVSRPSVSHAVHRLERENYIRVDSSRLISLTPAGRELASAVQERYDVFYQLFLSLGVPKGIASLDAGRIEHAISNDSFMLFKSMVMG